MSCSAESNHFINCMLCYFENIVYKKNETSYYIDERVDKIFEFEKWIDKLSDDEISYNCDYSKSVTPKDIREDVKKLVKNWVINNCEGSLVKC